MTATRPERSDADNRFDRTIERWFRDQLRRHPEWATHFGIHDHDDRLGSTSRDAIDEEIDFHRSSIAELERFSPDELSFERALDRDLAIHQARLALHGLEEYRTWSGASNAAEAIGGAIFPLFTRDFAPLADRLDSIASRLEAAPRFLAESRSRVIEPVRVWVEIDLQSCDALPSFLDTVLAAGRAENAGSQVVERLERAVQGVKAALAEHAAWLREGILPRADADWRAGPERFEEIVRLRELEANGDEILAVGEEMLASSKAERDRICAEIDPTLSTTEVADLVKNDHPATFPEALEEYRRAMDRARRFVADHDLATLPENDTLLVIETPSFIRHLIPFAAYYEPAKFDQNPMGTYVVTPPSAAEMMREHNYASISNTSVHEAYPGHHQQLTAAISNPSLVRLFSGAAEFAEGWAFYCERMMKEHGFDDTPRHRYIQYTDIIWRAARIVLDVRLHRGEVDFDAGVDFLVEQTGFERPAALAEVKRYTSTPTYQLSYLYGRHMIDRLKDEVERLMGAAFSLKHFHDTLLYGGTMPISYARRLFEEPDR
jgi:uncharacterized protein (DUF885 family)